MINLTLSESPASISSITISDSSGEEIIFTYDSSFFTTNVVPTGESHLTILSSSITTLNIGDEIGIFDANAIVNYNDCSNQIGELLVSSGIWDGSQLNLVSVGSVDMCGFGGVQLSGYISSNPIVIRIWDINEKKIKTALPQFSSGSGLFSDIITVVDELNF